MNVAMPSATSPLISGQMNQNTAAAEAASPNVISTIWKESSHPVALLFHYLFRSLAVLAYLFSGTLISDSFAFIVAMTVILLALDFWTVKNVTGRLLVGRRWWSTTQSDGGTVWSFEAKPIPWKPNPVDSKLFWASLYGYLAVWICLGLVAILTLSFSWLIIVLFALALNLTNLWGYLKCDREAQSQILNSVDGTFIGSYINQKFGAVFA